MWRWVKQEKPEESAILENGVVVRPVVTLVEQVPPSLVSLPGQSDGIRGKAHIIIDDHCYVVILETFAGVRRRGRFRMTPWIFKEAHQVLRELPAIEYPIATTVERA
jgi:hypothetical protein